MSDAKQGLRNLANVLIDDVMEMSEAEILAEMAEDGEDPDVVVEHMQVLIDQTIRERQKARRK